MTIPAKGDDGPSPKPTAHDLRIVAHVPLFNGLPQDALERIIATTTTIRRPRGETLFRQGDPPHALYILLDGQVGMMGIGGDGEETVVEILSPGEQFIAAAVLTGKPFLMSAITLTQARLLVLPREALMKELTTHPEIALAMLTSMAQAWRKLLREVKDLKLKSASQRIAHYLMTLTPKRQGSIILKLPHSKNLIAARVGVRPETLSRAFATLKEHGVVVDGQAVAITDLAHLGEFCHEGDEQV